MPILFVANLGLVVADAANLYANGHDLKDPMRKLRAAGVVADLMVFEGQSHAQYLFVPDAPEGKEYFIEVTAFLSGEELARCRTLRLGPFPVPPHKNCS